MHYITILLISFGLLYPPVILTSQESEEQLIAHWTFDGHVKDNSDNQYNGSAHGIEFRNGIIGQAAMFGKSGGAIYFPAKDSVPEPIFGSLEYGAISVWFNYKNMSNSGEILPILYFGESGVRSPHNSLIIEIGHGNKPENRKLYFTIINKRFCYDSRINLEPGRWYHFVAVVSPQGNTGYLNGEEIVNRHYNLGSNKSYTDFFSAVPVKELFSVGYGRYGKENAFYHFQGMIDDVRIYNKPLSAEEVKSLFIMAEEEISSMRDYSVPGAENISYGPYERNVLDFWKAESEEPTPLVVYIHGGGFRGGSKEQARKRYTIEIEEFLNHGISFASINYRFRSTDTSRLHEGTRLDTILLDCARAIQFLRYHSQKYNIDKDWIGAFGGSAGGGASLWLGTTDDLADPDNPDPVLRESSRIQAVGHLNSQATYDWTRWAEILDMPQQMVWDNIRTDDIELMQLKRDEMFDKGKEDVRRLCEILDMLGHITPDDPPILTDNRKENIVPGNVIHHPRHSLAVKAKCDAVGVECEINLADTPPEKQTGIVEFFLNHLQSETNQTRQNPLSPFNVYPNPATDHICIEMTGFHFPAFICIYNVQGKIMDELVVNDNFYTIDLSTYTKGFYFIHANSDKIAPIRKLLLK